MPDWAGFGVKWLHLFTSLKLANDVCSGKSCTNIKNLSRFQERYFLFPFEDGACQVVLRAMVCRGSLVIHKTLSTIQQHYSARSHQAIAMQHHKVCA